MIEDLTLVRNMVLAVATGYFLGALPFAHIASRIRGIDVFTTGSTLAGTANVFFNVGHRTGALVLVGDVAKGAAAGFAAWALAWDLTTEGAGYASGFASGGGGLALMALLVFVGPLPL